MKRIKYWPQQKLAIATQDGVTVAPGDLSWLAGIAMPGLGAWEVIDTGTAMRPAVFTRRASRPSPMVRAILKMLGAS